MPSMNLQLRPAVISVLGICLRAVTSALLFASALAALPASAQSITPPQPALTADDIVHNLELSNEARNSALHHFEGTRTYTLHYHGFPNNHDAEMVVTLSYQSPSSKEFKVVSQSGSKFIIDHVFKRMIESEREAAQDLSRNALTSRNYEFALAGYEQTPTGSCYVLKVSPRTNNKFLYRGKIWVDAADFAVVKIEAEPAQNPSFIIKRTEVHHRYKKVDHFWLPAENRTTSYLRIGGHADLAIEYEKYTITASDPIPPVAIIVASHDPGRTAHEVSTKSGAAE
jgi:outer membrane lipoprotein-sorting protein